MSSLLSSMTGGVVSLDSDLSLLQAGAIYDHTPNGASGPSSSSSSSSSAPSSAVKADAK